VCPTNSRARARDDEQQDWGEPPPFWFVRLSFVESREKDKYELHRGIEPWRRSLIFDLILEYESD
jgi:hypothetical protein